MHTSPRAFDDYALELERQRAYLAMRDCLLSTPHENHSRLLVKILGVLIDETNAVTELADIIIQVAREQGGAC